MKKISVVFTVLLLVSTSDPEPIKTITNPDMVFVDGKYQFLFDTPRIEHGKTYEVILTITDCDDNFIGSHLGGKICYKMDLNGEDEKVLSGWRNSVPDTVSKSIKTYTWKFKAGEKYSDRKDPETDATTPSGGKQYFAFTAQTAADWNDYDSSYNFNIKGGFQVKAVETITDWVSAGTLTLGNDGVVGKGELAATEVAKIRNMPANSKIVLTVHVTVNDSDAKPGNGVAAIGPDWNGGINITVPGDAVSGQTIDFEAEVEISSLLAMITNSVIINVYNGATITKAELFKPGT